MKTLLTSCILLFCTSANAQNYFHYDSLRLESQYSVCTVSRDSSSNEAFILKLSNLDTTLIVAGLSNYYRDLGFCYYKKYIYTKDLSFLNQAIAFEERGWNMDNTNTLAAWDLGILYFLNGDCEQSKKHFENYKTAMKLKNKKLSREDKKEINRLSKSKKCIKK